MPLAISGPIVARAAGKRLAVMAVTVVPVPHFQSRQPLVQAYRKHHGTSTGPVQCCGSLLAVGTRGTMDLDCRMDHQLQR